MANGKDNNLQVLVIIIMVITAITLVLLWMHDTRQQQVPQQATAQQAGIAPGSIISNNPGEANTPDTIQRVLITPLGAAANRQIRARSDVDVRHEFNGKFSANIPIAALSSIKKLATVEAVGISEIHQTVPLAKPVCGDNKCQGNEPKTCPSDCPAEEPPPEEGRQCSPANSREYNVLQVNGGKIGDGAGVNVAVLDTGTTPDHLDLDVKLCKDATKRGIRNGCADKSDSAHGTHTTGIVAANGGADGAGLFGVAPSANLWAIKVCGNTFCFNDDIAAAINFAATEGANIINMSFGGASQSSLISQAIADHPEVLFIASSGNSGPDPDTIGYPAANPAVVAVAANDKGKVIARFSSRGIDDGNDATIAEWEVELSAGGVTVESTNKDGCYSSLSGTSFSSPTVAGLAAKLWAVTPADTRAALVSFAQDITEANGGGAEEGFDIASGYGLPVAP